MKLLYKSFEFLLLRVSSMEFSGVGLINAISPYSLEELNPEINKNLLYEFMEKLVENEVFQYYPKINFIGLDYKLGFYFKTKDQNN